MHKDESLPAGPVLTVECMCPLCLEKYQEDPETFLNHKSGDEEPCPAEIKAEVDRLFLQALGPSGRYGR